MAAASPAATLSRIPFDTVPILTQVDRARSPRKPPRVPWPKRNCPEPPARDGQVALATRFRDRVFNRFFAEDIPQASWDTELPTNNSCVVSSAYWGRITLSITWITPLLAAMSVAVTVALSTRTLPSATLILTSEPCTVLALESLTTSAAMTLPGTT